MAYDCEQAQRDDIPGIARLFAEAFADTLLHVCGTMPHMLALTDVFALVYETEPAAAFVVRDQQRQVVGYVFAPTDIRRLWRTALIKGHLGCWLFRYVSGQYGIGLYPLRILLHNKWGFVRSALTKQIAANARILSIAVAAGARQHGVGRRLMERALTYFADQQVRRIRLEVRPWNAPAKHIYESLGFVSAGFSSDSQGQWLIMLKEMG